MQDSGLVEIQVSRLIPAEKWRILRLLTKVWEFPTYMPNVKEATIIQKDRNKMITKWRVQVDGVPIQWVEEEQLRFHENIIQFKAIDGDLSEFRGEWRLDDAAEGTMVTVTIFLRVEIPAIREFAVMYLKKMITRNFESILEGLEKRLISLRYRNIKDGWLEKIAGFGIIGHPYNFKHLEQCFKMLNPEFKVSSVEFISKLFHISPSFKLYDILNIRSKTGQTVNGCFIIATFVPDMIEKDMWMVFSKVVKACKIAEKHGMGIVTLGGFTSIVAERIGQEIFNEVDIAVTSGNTFTAAMTIEGVLKAARLMGVDIASQKVAIVGGTGDIGSACARILSSKAKKVTVTGRTRPNLNNLAKELQKCRKAQIAATTDNREAVRDADIVIAAASATSSILEVNWFKPGAIVCDVGYPKNISYAPVTREDILVFSGGLAKPPVPVSFPIDLGLPSPETLYGCFAEGIILALEKRYENYSFGRGNITVEKIEEMRAMGAQHGFEAADFYWGERLIDETILRKAREARTT